MNDYIKALKAGKQIVIVNNNENAASCIFWKDGNKAMSFSVESGIEERPLNNLIISEHFENLLYEGNYIFIR